MANKKPRGRETAWDMILSMGAVIAAVGVIMLLAWRPQEEVKQQCSGSFALFFEGGTNHKEVTQECPLVV